MYRLCFAALVLLCQYGCAGTVTVLLVELIDMV